MSRSNCLWLFVLLVIAGCGKNPEIIYEKFDVKRLTERHFFLEAEVENSAIAWARSNGLVVDIYSIGDEKCNADFDPENARIDFYVEKIEDYCVLKFEQKERPTRVCKLVSGDGLQSFFASSFLEEVRLSSGEPIMDGRDNSSVFEIDAEKCVFFDKG